MNWTRKVASRGASLAPAAAALLLLLLVTIAAAQEVRCGDYGGLDQTQRAYLAYGYLEGVQAALDKERMDILVPPSDPRHPLWWVLPAGLTERPFIGLAEKVDAYCQSPNNRRDDLLRAFLSLSVQQEGRPGLGVATNRKEAESWKNFLGGKDTSLSCADYLASPELTRQAILYGYYLATEAFRIRLGRSFGTPTVWPSSLSPQVVRQDVDLRCGQDRAGTFRGLASVATAELSGRKP